MIDAAPSLQFNLRQLLSTISVASLALAIGTAFGLAGLLAFGSAFGIVLMCLGFRQKRLAIGNLGFATLMTSIAIGALTWLCPVFM